MLINFYDTHPHELSKYLIFEISQILIFLNNSFGKKKLFACSV